jgi:hypothetical protein
VRCWQFWSRCRQARAAVTRAEPPWNSLCRGRTRNTNKIEEVHTAAKRKHTCAHLHPFAHATCSEKSALNFPSLRPSLAPRGVEFPFRERLGTENVDTRESTFVRIVVHENSKRAESSLTEQTATSQAFAVQNVVALPVELGLIIFQAFLLFCFACEGCYHLESSACPRFLLTVVTLLCAPSSYFQHVEKSVLMHPCHEVSHIVPVHKCTSPDRRSTSATEPDRQISSVSSPIHSLD